MTATRSAPDVELDVILAAHVPVPRGYVYRAEGNLLRRLRAGLTYGGGVVHSPCLAYVIRHPDAGVIVVDTGLHANAISRLRADFGGPMGLLFRGLVPAGEPFDAQLRASAIDPSTVERVVMTHLHVDHTSGMRLLPSARFTCAREEWAATRGRLAAVRGYASHHLPPTERMDLVDFGVDGETHGPFSRTVDLVGDDTVRLISTPGHTPGHTSVLVRRRGGDEVLLVGDAAYTLRNIRDRILPMLTDDDAASRSSLDQIASFCERNPKAIVVPSHDPVAWEKLRAPAAERST